MEWPGAVNPVQLALITWHSMKEMVFEGGPGPWVLEPSRFFLELKMDDKKKFQVAEVRLPARRKQNQYIYRVTCLELGEQVFTFQVGNHPGVLNPSPAVETVQVNFLCAHPASMAVTPVYKMAAGTPPCPLPQHHKQLVPVSSLRNTILELALFDQHRRKFDNFSSLILEWTSANESLARFTHPRSMQMVEKDDGTGQTRLHAVELLLVEDVTVVPDNVTMYNHPDVKEVFALVEGSGYFLINSSTQDMANITYLETESAIQIFHGITTGLKHNYEHTALTLRSQFGFIVVFSR
ncbi:nuclear pore membrane glycoprotein 210-like [Pituophis catenifer annectens]|uniref:nuclear pore membrane glycoprotein 210-like n=1 Tax=Pituophis catenifer annectens TaxID=94852 RepID=UPI00399191E9